MVQEVTEHVLAIFGLFHGVEDVAVPELVDVLARRDRLFRIFYGQRQKPLVFDCHLIHVLARPALPFLGIHQLELDGIRSSAWIAAMTCSVDLAANCVFTFLTSVALNE